LERSAGEPSKGRHDCIDVSGMLGGKARRFALTAEWGWARLGPAPEKTHPARLALSCVDYAPGLGARSARAQPDNDARLHEPELRHSRSDHFSDVRWNKVGIVPLGHARVGMAQIGCDYRQRGPGSQQVRSIGVAQNVEARRRIDPGAMASLA
jgi:hypothetical protein